MIHPVLRKLEFFSPLPEKDRDFVLKIIAQERQMHANCDLASEGEKSASVYLMTSGFACRYKRFADGKRQIVAFLLPGDFSDPYAVEPRTMDHSISTLVSSHVVHVSRETMLEMFDRPALARAFLMATLADWSTLREWIATIGQRSAENRIAHLFCEIVARLTAVGLGSDNEVQFPLTQQGLSDCIGVSLVHTNRSLKSLREKSLVIFEKGNLRIIDTKRLHKLCDFTPGYLHLS